MSLDQRKDEDLAQIMEPAEFSEYKRLERMEERAYWTLHDARRDMRKMRSKARARQRRNGARP